MKTLHFLTVIFLLTSATATLSAEAEEDSPVNKHTRRTSEHGDAGKFSGNNPDNTNVLILWPGDAESIVRRIRPATHTGAAPKAFKLWKNAGGSGGFPVNLKSSAGFCSFIRKIESSPGLDGCICDDNPGNIEGRTAGCNPAITLAQCTPSQCDTSDGGDTGDPGDKPGDGPYAPAPIACTSWSTGSWSPSRSSRCSGTSFTQTRSVYKVPSGCSGTPPGRPRSSRSTTGTKTSGKCSTNTAPPPPVTPSPPPVTPCTATAWSPSTGSRCRGTSFTQSRTVCPGNRTESRSATGAKCCGSATPWSPGTSARCKNETFTQTRTNSCGERETRTATGTQNCKPACAGWSAGSWTPSGTGTCSTSYLTQTRPVAATPSGCTGTPPTPKPGTSRRVKGSKDCSDIVVCRPGCPRGACSHTCHIIRPGSGQGPQDTGIPCQAGNHASCR